MKKVNRSVRARHRAFFRNHTFLLAAAAAASLALHPPIASASGTDQWIGGNSSDWNTNTNWSPMGVPGPGDIANVTSLLGVTQNIAYDYGGLTLTLGTLDLNLVNGASPSSEILTISTAKTLAANTENIGGFSGSPSGNSGGGGNGTLTQSAGSNVVGVGGLYLGFNGADQGFYNLSGSGVLSADQEEIGVSGTGTFNQTGGTHTVTAVNVTNPAALIVGFSGTGTYTQSAGALSTPGDEFVGYVGTGNFNQSGGTNTANGTAGLVVAFSAPGSYTLSNTAVLSVSGLTIGNGDVGTFTQTGGTNTVGTLGMVVGVFASGTYTMSGNSTLTAPQENIGGTKGSIQAVGNFTQTAGSNTINTSGLFLGFNSKDQGAYTLNGGTLFVNAGTETIGVSGTGTFTQTAGSNTLSPFTDQKNLMFLGKNVGSVGTYTLSGTGSVSVFEEEIGVSGTGVFTQSAGSNTLFSNLSIDLGVNTGSTGTYNLSNTGTISASFFETIGDQGTGIFNQSGGTNNTNDGILNIANMAKSTGAYTLTSTGVLTAEMETVGLGGNGAFTQTGGNNSVGQSLNIGNNAGSTGTYTLSSTGTLSAIQESIGVSGTGFYNQDGGTNTLSSNSFLNIAQNTGSSGTFVMIGGTTSASDVNVGGNDSGQTGGKGILTVSVNGVLNATSQLQVYPGKGSIINLTGGTINTANLNLNGNPSSFNWTSGTLGLTQSVTFDPSAADNTTGAAFGSSLTLGANQALIVTGIETIGGGAPFTFTNSGGTNTVTGSGGDLFVGNSTGSTGTYILSNNGSISATGEAVGIQGTGFYAQTSGTNTDAGNLDVGIVQGASGTFTLSGGTTTVAGDVLLGALNPSSSVPGNLTVNGTGTLSVAGTLAASDGGTINLSGGTINTSALNFNGTPSCFNWTSGTLGLTQSVSFDPSQPGTTTAAAFGPALTVGPNETLNVTGSESLGGGAAFTLTVSGGENNILGGHDLNIAPIANSTGVYLLSGGTTSVSGIIYVGGSGSGPGGKGTLSVSGTGQLTDNGALQIDQFGVVNINGGSSTVAGLNISLGGQLNVNGPLLIKYSSPGNDPVATIRSELTAAYKAHYTGTALAITSSTAGAKPAAFAVGYVDNATKDQLTIALTVPGDTDLSGSTDFNDLTTVAQFFGQSIAKGNNVGWQTGDVNYDGQVDFNDLTIVAQFFGDSLTKAEAGSLPGSFVAQYDLALAEVGKTAAVPEPGTVGVMAVGGIGLLSRRKRR